MFGLTSEEWLIFGPLVGAVVLVALSGWLGGVTSFGVLTDAMGPPNYDFSKSWASNITVVGALLGTILNAQKVIASTPRLSQTEYAALNLFFGIVVVLSPFIFRASSRVVKVTGPQGVADTQYQGLVLGFLVATALTVWAVAGEVVTILLLFGDLQAPSGALTLFTVLLAICACLLIYYVGTSVPSVIRNQHDAEVHAQSVASITAHLNAIGVPLPAPITPPKPQWSIL